MKVYIVEVGGYSDRYIDVVFTTRELAEAYIEDQKHRAYEAAKAKHEAFWAQFPPDVRPSLASRIPREFPKFDGKDWDHGSIEEHEVWDVIPVVGVVS